MVEEIIGERFWETRTLAQMNRMEWEALCDGCAKCCLHKLEDEDDGQVYYTSVACKKLDLEQCRCTVYEERLKHVPDCLDLIRENLNDLSWLPSSCAYRLVSNGEPLPSWHHLISGDRDSIHRAGMSVRGRVVSELEVDDEEIELYIIDEFKTESKT